MALIQETQNAARVGWFIQAATVNLVETAIAMNPTNPDDRWVFLPDESLWLNPTTKEKLKTIPMCKHKPEGDDDGEVGNR